MFTDKDKNQIVEKGITLEQVSSQVSRFKEGFASAHISEPATIGNGIKKLSEQEIDIFIEQYEKSDVSVMKFVPASGAASRMFKLLFAFLDECQSGQSPSDLIAKDEKVRMFFDQIHRFAFYPELNELLKERAGKAIEEAIEQNQHGEVLKFLLLEEGLNYGNLPKGLLSFHSYDGEIRTPAQEHLHEGLSYAMKSNQVNIHFTVSPEHQQAFESHVKKAVDELDSDVSFTISYSTQKPETDTVAVTPEFELFRDNDNNLLFRPAGHGALLSNLVAQLQDIIFIKNIDNVVPDKQKAETIRYKKALAGVLLEYQAKIFSLLTKHDQGADIHNEGKELLEEMGVRGFNDDEVAMLLNRPIRVCGMVKNEGEPGGGPFWVKGSDGQSLQIVESAQVDMNKSDQVSLFKKGTHFNPVDLVCGVRNYQGEKFNLLEHRDEDTGFISEKSAQGKKLLAMELPGLWNGAMADWNTIFVEVPLITFNPVKTVNDLLKPTHH